MQTETVDLAVEMASHAPMSRMRAAIDELAAATLRNREGTTAPSTGDGEEARMLFERPGVQCQAPARRQS